ncbi:CaiB/BaiF CoA transferase family protein [Cytobacillus purgationiresistens]|uniref:Crotonobetainyl-CoA:carnitine CoA-transferase CaiB-like acyl-CoA transferase n=1 Tax=Cytobacillus purgationiresistens TaxID=863449 RepID=A0ABU0APH3_9BACI|nr:CaiB/BaiF CoA-transferase family protein [Cytobacillus purgationiresistens]MDQ0272298.1 crotonobetainyl-CoA:carnitine CoA-transferase CaiB-like acyl-CoA transferase [Cytobacillus purgationiresistens]
MLEGIKVVDFSNYLPGPYATMRLAELGAEIIKIEAPGGDPARSLDVQLEGTGIVFLANNHRKKSMTLNLKTIEGRDIAKKLIAEADAVLESFRPGVMRKLGLDYDSVAEMNPGLVYCSLTGYGNSGKQQHFGSHDLNYMALSGMLAQLKDSDGKPIHPSHTMADYIGGVAASERILAGLVSRGVNGKGSYHCIAITDVMTSMMGNHLVMNQAAGVTNGVDVLSGSIINYAIYETKDHRFIALAALEEKFWRNFCQAADKAEWMGYYNAKTTDEIYTEVEKLFQSKLFSEWISFSETVDCCMTPILEIDELAQFSYFKDRESIVDVNNIQHAKSFADREGASSTPPPLKGEHTEMIIKQVLGKELNLGLLREKGII